MGTVTCDGAELFFEESGQGEPLLLIHGTGGDTAVLAALAESLASSFHTIRYDRRAFGKSAAALPGAKTYLARHVADATELLRTVAPSGATIFGWSWGGIITLSLALAQPELVRRIVLFEPPLHAKKHMTIALLKGIGGAILLGKLGMHRRGAIHFAKFALRRPDGSNAFDDMSAAMRESILASARTMIRELEAGTGEELDESLRAVSCPVTVIIGGRSLPFYRAAAERIATLIPSAQLVRAPSGDHLMPVLLPDELASVVRRSIA